MEGGGGVFLFVQDVVEICQCKVEVRLRRESVLQLTEEQIGAEDVFGVEINGCALVSEGAFVVVCSHVKDIDCLCDEVTEE
eukprot:2959796-Rhodomonas_salina.1